MFTKGKPKTGGRRKGTPNKVKPLSIDLVREMAAKGVDPVAEIILLLSSKSASDRDKMTFWMALLPYMSATFSKRTIEEPDNLSAVPDDELERIANGV